MPKKSSTKKVKKKNVKEKAVRRTDKGMEQKAAK